MCSDKKNPSSLCINIITDIKPQMEKQTDLPVVRKILSFLFLNFIICSSMHFPPCLFYFIRMSSTHDFKIIYIDFLHAGMKIEYAIACSITWCSPSVRPTYVVHSC